MAEYKNSMISEIDNFNSTLISFISTIDKDNSIKNYYQNNLYCIVEGKDDKEYYRPLLTNGYFETGSRIVILSAGGKENVIKYMNKFNSTYCTLKKQFIFIVDRDFHFPPIYNDPLIPPKYGEKVFDNVDNPENLYVTDKYSIENSIFTGSTIYNICEEKYNGDTKAKREAKREIANKIKKIYINQLLEYENGFIKIISLLFYCKINNIEYKLSIETNHLNELYNLNEGQIEWKKSSEDIYQELIQHVKIDKTINDSEIENIKNKIKDNISQFFRGHFLESFWNKYTKYISEIKGMEKKQISLHDSSKYVTCIETLRNFIIRTFLKYDEELKKK